MESIIFEPITGDASSTVSIFLIFTVVGLGTMILSFIKNWKVLSLLGFMAFMISGGSLLMNYLATQKLTPFTIYEDAIDTLYGRYDFEDLASSKIEEGGTNNTGGQPFQNETQRYLIIKTTTKETLPISENSYPIDEIKEALDKRIAEWAKNR